MDPTVRHGRIRRHMRKLINLANIFDNEKPFSRPTTRRRPKSVDGLTKQLEDNQENEESSGEIRNNPIEILANRLIADYDIAKQGNHVNWKAINKGFIGDRSLKVYWPIRTMNYLASLAASSDVYNLATDLLQYHKSTTKDNKVEIPMQIAYISMLSKNDCEQFWTRYQLLVASISYFDSTSCLTLIQALCNTQHYQLSLPYIPMVTMTTNVTSSHYSPILRAALAHDNYTLFDRLVGEMAAERLTPISAVFSDLVAMDNGDGCYVNRLVALITQYKWLPDQDVANQLSHWFTRKSKLKWTTQITSVHGGLCQSCKSPLKPIKKLTKEEFDRMREKFLEKSLKREDIFLNTNPEEFQRFVEMLDSNKAFDVVIDALNVAYSTTQKASTLNRARIVESIVEFFLSSVNRDRPPPSILVIGRNHMRKWPLMSNLRATKTFFTEDTSKDDPFMLYSALRSGSNCFVVTRDELRDHRHLLACEHNIDSFKTWQRTNQIYFKAVVKGRPTFAWPDVHETICQMESSLSPASRRSEKLDPVSPAPSPSDDASHSAPTLRIHGEPGMSVDVNSATCCHIPFDCGRQNRTSFELTNSWLCVKRSR